LTKNLIEFGVDKSARSLRSDVCIAAKLGTLPGSDDDGDSYWPYWHGSDQKQNVELLEAGRLRLVHSDKQAAQFHSKFCSILFRIRNACR
jgi:hypothetical protein